MIDNNPIGSYDKEISEFINSYFITDANKPSINEDTLFWLRWIFSVSDSVYEASKINVTHIVQPGGSVADKNVIEACNINSICMINTGVRAFHH